ncbi:AsmA family protein [Thiolapillus brandeum]|uniref:AsmA protein n=1 Tax=Thiolapillus brandeum TaxID=1076588 RepID=A0A7U6GI18_9GAMM|nr:AsmA family protein [Thiolapillus brandeum]BAO44028.1 AsmA protein [Thiolapillus brandeum]
MKIIKWLIGLLVTLVVIVALGVVALKWFVDEDMLKDKASIAFKEQTGQELKIAGPLNWSVFPWVGLELGDVTIGSAPGFGDTPLAVVKRLDVKVALKPLLQKKVAVDTVVLRGVRLDLRRDRNGKVNWEGLAKAGEGKPDTAPRKKAEKSDFDMQDFDFRLQGVEVEDASFHFTDELEGNNLQLDDLNFTMGELRPGKPVPLRLRFQVKNSRPLVKVALELSTDMVFQADFQRLDLSALSLDVDAQGENLPAEGVKLALASNIGLDRKAGVLALSDFSLSGMNVDVTGDMSVSALNSDQPRVEARLALQNTNLRQLLTLVGVELKTTDPDVLKRVSANFFVAQEGDGLTVKPLSISLDDSKIDGSLKILSFKGPVVRAGFKLDAMDLDRYLPPAEQAQASSGGAAAKPAGQGGKPDFTALRKLDLDADLGIGRLKVSGLTMENIVLKLRSHKGVLNLDPLTAALYQGKLKMNAQLDVRKDTPRFNARETLSGIQIEPLLNDLTGNAQLRGTGDIKMDINSQGLDDASIRRHLNGNFAINFRDGAYIGINIAQAIRKAMGQATTDEPEETDFAELKGTGVIRKGVVDNQDLYLASPVLRVTGKGKVDLVKEQADYLLTTKVVDSLKGQGGADASKLKGVAIPVRISGDIRDPSIRVDVAAALKSNAEYKVKEKIQEKVKDKLGTDALKGLFGG